MPLLRLRDDYTAETFMQDFYDGNLGMGIWGGGNTDYNFVVSFQKMSPEDQQTVLGRIRRDPRALEILHRIEAQYDETIAYDDYRGIGLALYPMIDEVEEFQSRMGIEETPALYVPGWIKWRNHSLRSEEVCDAPIGFHPEDQKFREACYFGYLTYYKMPLYYHLRHTSDFEQMEPKTADVCAKSVFDRSVREYFANPERLKRKPDAQAAWFREMEDAYYTCEDVIGEREFHSDHVLAIVAALIPLLPQELQSRYRRGEWYPSTGGFKTLVKDGWHAELIRQVSWNDQSVWVEFHDSSRNDTRIVRIDLDRNLSEARTVENVADSQEESIEGAPDPEFLAAVDEHFPFLDVYDVYGPSPLRD